MSDMTQDDGINPFSERIGHQSILVVGIAGKGKTFLASTAPGKVAWMAIEKQGLDNLKQAIVMHGRDRNDIHVFDVRHQWDPNNPKRLLKNREGKPLSAMQYLKDKLAQWEVDPQGFDSIVIDSGTALQELEKFLIQREKGKLTQQDWMKIIDDLTYIALTLRDLRMNSLMIFTSNQIQDEESKMYHRISVYGKKLFQDLPRYFNLAVTMVSKTDRAGEETYSAITKGDDRYITKGHLALDRIEVPNVQVWFDKMSKFWKDNEQTGIPQDGEQTSEAQEPELSKSEQRLANPKTTKLFEDLSKYEVWPKAKRLRCVDKYRQDEKLWSVLEARLEAAVKKEEEKDSK